MKTSKSMKKKYEKSVKILLTKSAKDANINNVVGINISIDMERWSSWFMAPVLKIGVR